jgi:hypothetical protein
MLQVLGRVANLFKSWRRLEVENLFLQHQLNIAMRGAPYRVRLRGSDRALSLSLLGLSRVVQPDTILRWHRAGVGPTGAGNLAVVQGGPELAVSCANSSDG